MTTKLDLTMARGSADNTFGVTLKAGGADLTFTDVRIRVFIDAGNSLAFTSMLGVDVAVAGAKITWTPSLAQVNMLQPGLRRNMYTLEAKVSGVWIEKVYGDITAEGSADAVRDMSAGGDPVIEYEAAHWYTPPGHIFGATATPGVNSLMLVPFIPDEDVTVTDLGVFVTTLQAASNAALAIYASNPATRKPTGLSLARTANISTATSAALGGALNAPVALAKGTLYYLALNTDTAGLVFFGVTGLGDIGSKILGGALITDILTNQIVRSGWKVAAQTFASGFPDVTAATFVSAAGTTPAVVFKTAA